MTTVSFAPTVVKLTGEFGAGRQAELRALIAPLISAHRAVLDLTPCEYFSSIFLEELMQMRVERRKAGLPQARLVIPSPALRKVMHVVGFSELFLIHETIEDALYPHG